MLRRDIPYTYLMTIIYELCLKQSAVISDFQGMESVLTDGDEGL